jgi:hypothetical protein
VSPLSPRSSPSAALLGVDVTDTMRRLCNGKLSVSIHTNKDVLFGVPQPGPISTPHAWAGGRSGGTRKLVVALTLFGHASQRTFLHGVLLLHLHALSCEPYFAQDLCGANVGMESIRAATRALTTLHLRPSA